MQQKECEDTWGDFELQQTATQPNIPSGVKGAQPDFLSFRDPRRGDWIDTRNNFTRPTAAVPLAADLTWPYNGLSYRLGAVRPCGVVGSARRTNLLVGMSSLATRLPS